ncbi:GvpL/GvpF family gas vesicle protein [Streptomyces sp. NPDC001595]|uniref:GvpL/GvpF family gas vesicle protein n=1 Tax=Streptomyces sp. NPDC001532 TaxID=3154520 RepID=UPI00331F15B6
MEPQLSYAYAVVRASDPPDPPWSATVSGVSGVAGGAVRSVSAGRVAAVVSSVAEADFGETALKAHLEDLDWLEGVARAHHAVVEAVAAHTTVLPLRLATVYLDDDRVREVLRRGEEAFTAALERLTGAVEWGVKVYAQPPVAPAETAVRGDAVEALDPGRSYLRSRRRERSSREVTWAAATEAVRRIDAEAGALALDRARHRPQQGRLADVEGVPGENVANDAYLVPLERAEEFQERVRRSAAGLEGVRVEITGPWAPYSFAVLPAPAGADDR